MRPSRTVRLAKMTVTSAATTAAMVLTTSHADGPEVAAAAGSRAISARNSTRPTVAPGRVAGLHSCGVSVAFPYGHQATGQEHRAGDR